MITVGIRNLKDSLSKYLRMVKSGERVIVTDHNTVVAEIIPPSPNDNEETLFQQYLSEQIISGKVVPATKRGLLDSKRASKSKIDAETIRRVFEQSRNERT